jgi:branched-chain amino acid transport system permease protein
MLYREAGQFKTTYRADQAIFPIAQDRYALIFLLVVAFAVVPAVADEYWLRSIITPFLCFSLAAVGLNILTGYAGQLSLGSSAFMAVGAFAAYNLNVRLGLPFYIYLPIAGLIAAAVGVVFGLPSLRIKGFYLIVTTLAAHFFIEWLFTRVPWFTNNSSSGVIDAPPLRFFGVVMESYITLVVVAILALAAKNMVRSAIGRAWMAVRDMDIAAEIVGVPILKTKLLAFAVSSFYLGVAGVLWAFIYLGSVEPQAFTLDRAFQILFMIIIGGLGSILGSFLGAAFIVLLPILLSNLAALFGHAIAANTLANLELVVFGGLIIFFLIVEPYGLARLWQISKEKLRLWPFPY